MEGAGVIPGSSLFLIMETLKQKVKEGKVQIKINLGFCPNNDYKGKRKINLPDLTKEEFRRLMCSDAGKDKNSEDSNQSIAIALIRVHENLILKAIKKLGIYKPLMIRDVTICIESVNKTKRFIRGLVDVSGKRSVLFFLYWTGISWEYYIPIKGNWINPETTRLYGSNFESDRKELEKQCLPQIEECNSNRDIRFLTDNYPHQYVLDEFLEAANNKPLLDYEQIRS